MVPYWEEEGSLVAEGGSWCKGLKALRFTAQHGRGHAPEGPCAKQQGNAVCPELASAVCHSQHSYPLFICRELGKVHAPFR